MALLHLRLYCDGDNTALGFEKGTILFFRELRDLVSEKDTVGRLNREEQSRLRKLAIVKAELCTCSE